MSENLTKDLNFGEECRSKLLSGIQKLSKAVKSTLGPHGKTVILESLQHTHGITVTKDGVTVARSIELIDPVENMGVRVVKQAAEETATIAADGTTTAIVLAEAMIEAGTELITPDLNKTEVLRCMDEMVGDVVEGLKSKSVPCTDEILLQVATVSSNNDDVIGALIAKAYKEVGDDGIVTVERSMTPDTYSEVIDGLRVTRGYITPQFINNRERDERVMTNVRIFVCDKEIEKAAQIEQMLKPIIAEGISFLLISPCSAPMVNQLAANVIGGVLNACIVPPPNFGWRQHELLEDIALSVGATFFSEKNGDDLSLMNFTHLGFATKVVVGKEKTVIYGGKGDQALIDARITELRVAHDLSKKKLDKDFIKERIASLAGGIGAIYVGGNTDMEQKELFDRVEDAVGAVRSALKEGVIAGAGKPLFEASLAEYPEASPERTIAWEILKKAMVKPLIQILNNADLGYKDIYTGSEAEGVGYNIKTKLKGNLMEMGVIDPLLVTRTALQNAVSVAITILSTDTSINISRV